MRFLIQQFKYNFCQEDGTNKYLCFITKSPIYLCFICDFCIRKTKWIRPLAGILFMRLLAPCDENSCTDYRYGWKNITCFLLFPFYFCHLGLYNVYISPKANQNFHPVLSNFPPVLHISLMYSFVLSVKVTKFPGKELPDLPIFTCLIVVSSISSTPLLLPLPFLHPCLFPSPSSLPAVSRAVSLFGSFPNIIC